MTTSMAYVFTLTPCTAGAAAANARGKNLQDGPLNGVMGSLSMALQMCNWSFWPLLTTPRGPLSGKIN